MTFFLPPPTTANELPPTRSLEQTAPLGREQQVFQDVDQLRSDAEREAHIADCAWLMERAYARYEASGCFSDREESDRWRVLRDEAVRGRSAAAVARMEAERGLA